MRCAVAPGADNRSATRHGQNRRRVPWGWKRRSDLVAGRRNNGREKVPDTFSLSNRHRTGNLQESRRGITMPNPPKYVLQGSFDVPPEKWVAAKEEIRRVLVAKARQRAMIPYSELLGW